MRLGFLISNQGAHVLISITVLTRGSHKENGLRHTLAGKTGKQVRQAIGVAARSWAGEKVGRQACQAEVNLLPYRMARENKSVFVPAALYGETWKLR